MPVPRISFFLSVLLLASCVDRPAAPGFLFSIPAASGSLTGPRDDELTLHLVGARDYFTQFSDRPMREAFIVANVDFVGRFASYFPDSRPNAVLTFTPADDEVPVSIVLTIGEPSWDSDTLTWTFSATRIRAQLDSLPGSTVEITPPDIANPESFAHGTLVIDDSIDNGGQGG